MATNQKSKTKRTTTGQKAKESRRTQAKQGTEELQEFPISRSMLRHIYDSMIQSRLWAQSQGITPNISEATAIPAALSVKATDIFTAPADGRTLYPIVHKEIPVFAYDPATLREQLCNLRRKHSHGIALALVSESDFNSSGSLFQEALAKHLPIVWVVLANRRFDPDAPVFEIDVDGHDAVAVFRVLSESIRRARNGRGPVVIHAHRANTPLSAESPDNPLGRFEAYLNAKGLSADDIHVLHRT
jgi:hypothetical protein